MSGDQRGWVWLNGPRYNVRYLFDPGSGQVVRTVKLPRAAGNTAGVGRRCGTSFVAVYVAPDRRSLFVQVGGDWLPLDGATVAVHERRLGGTVSRLSITRPGGRPLGARLLIPASALLWRLDPGYDELDRSMDDFLADVADLVNSEARRDWFVTVKDPDAGPWEVGSWRRPAW
jgi:hypothetical protein